MNRTLTLLATLTAASLMSTACAFESKSELLLPTEPGAFAAAAAPLPSAPTAPSDSSGSLGGTWTSEAITVPSPGSCGNFQWQITSATETSLAGSFSATCGGDIVVTGTGSGRVEGTSVPIAIAGTATYAGAISCDFSFSGTGIIEDRDTITIPYTGLTCAGPISGTERLHRPSAAAPPAPEPPPPPAPADPLFGCGGLAEQSLVECIWNHIRPTDHVAAFEVTKRVAWALRGEGAGLLLKNGGENVAAWRGDLFSASRIVYPDGRLVKVIFDAGPGGANGPSWQDNGDYVERRFYMAPMDPALP
jgi:hypothetical protein